MPNTHCNQKDKPGSLAAQAEAMWRTPQGQEPGILPERLTGEPGHRMYNVDTGRLAQYSLTQQTAMWSTPAAAEAVGRGQSKRAKAHGWQDTLCDQAKLWATPNVPNGGRMRAADEREPGARSMDLGEQVAKLWQTPQEPKGGGTARSGDRKGEPLLDGQARQWLTPAARDYKSGDASQATLDRNARPLNEIAENFPSGRPDPTTSTAGQPSSPNTPNSPRRLNPLFCEWLMSYPPGWTRASIGCALSGTLLTAWLARRLSYIYSLVCRRPND